MGIGFGFQVYGSGFVWGVGFWGAKVKGIRN
jgi:hypothetical protein